MPKISQAPIADYLQFGYVPAPMTIFEGINKLGSGSIFVVEANAALRIVDDWKLRFEHDDAKPDVSWGSG